MTNEEASNILDDFDVNFEGHTAEEVAEAFDVAFRALEQEPCEDCVSREEALMSLTGDVTDCTIEEYIARLREKLSKLPSVGKDINVTTNEDCISRENLLKAFKDECRGECDNCPYFRKVDGEYKCRLIAYFPSAIPQHQLCGDCISRQAVLDEINRIGIKAFETYNDYSELYDFVDNLPSVTPKKTETWNGIHAQITAPKDTLEQIFNDADDDNDI